MTQLRDRSEDEEADAHEQQAEADQVVVKYGNRNPAGTEDKPIWVVTFEVWNYSRRPVKRVSVRSNVSEERCVVAGSLQPDERGPGQFVLTRSDTAGPPGGARPTFEVFFTDWRRTTWRRPENGDAHAPSHPGWGWTRRRRGDVDLSNGKVSLCWMST